MRCQNGILKLCCLSANISGDAARWGDKENGVAGHGDTEGHQYTPKLLERLSGKKVVQLSACGFHTGCLTDMGEVRTNRHIFTFYHFGGLSFASVCFIGCHSLLCHFKYTR
jgi:hypothetical protein